MKKKKSGNMMLNIIERWSNENKSFFPLKIKIYRSVYKVNTLSTQLLVHIQIFPNNTMEAIKNR